MKQATGPLAHDDQLIGLYVTARSARKDYDGVVLAPRPGARSSALRLALDETHSIVPLNPRWIVEPHASLTRDARGRILALTQRVNGRPSYRYGDLPARHLATKTMLKREHRKQPAAGQQPIAWYRLHKDWAPLYAITDADDLAPLPNNRDLAWHAARTCSRCGEEHGSPLQRSPQPEGDRYCAPCHEAAAVERWIAQVRPVQLEMAGWAREVLADPLTVLVANHTAGRCPTYLVESVAGEQLLHATLRSFDDPDLLVKYPDYAGTVSPREILPQLQLLDGSRIITWAGLHDQDFWAWDSDNQRRLTPRLASRDEDRLAERFRLWNAVLPAYRGGFWYPQPTLPWNSSGSSEHERGYRTAQTAKDRVRWLRIYLQRMATEQLPEPTAGKQD